MDEPFSELDPVNVEIIKEVILQEKKRGATILFSDHDMSKVEELCDDVVMINNGHIVLNGAVNDVRNNFGLTRLFIRTGLNLDNVKNLPGVENAILQNNGIYKLWLTTLVTEKKFLIRSPMENTCKLLIKSHQL